MKNLNKIITLIIVATAAQSALADRPNINFCGTTSRSGANLYSGVGSFIESNTCSPDGNTKALFVTRDGAVSGNGASWLAYLNAGGVIVTEYTSAARVYNEVYGTSIMAASFRGGCGDNAMPAVKLNPTDPFWVSNAGLVETASGVEGCGNDIAPIVTADPTITPLGGFAGGGTQLARKIQGAGVLFLLEADWQDFEPSWTPSSASLMGALINAANVPPAPTIASVLPATGSTAGGTSVVITGSNFTGATAVTFSGRAATIFTVDSDSQITAVTPAGVVGAAAVAVTALGGTVATGTFTYAQAAPAQVASIPTLSEWAMIIMSGLMALFAIRELRRK